MPHTIKRVIWMRNRFFISSGWKRLISSRQVRFLFVRRKTLRSKLCFWSRWWLKTKYFKSHSFTWTSVLFTPVCGQRRGELGCRCSSGCWYAGRSSSESRGSCWRKCGCSSRSDEDIYCTPYGPVKNTTHTHKQSGQIFKSHLLYEHEHFVSAGWMQCRATEPFIALSQHQMHSLQTRGRLEQSFIHQTNLSFE